ncbi:MAG: YlbL family protein [Corynebacterium sp.]|uniref:YlbL family protein n=1 Tax=unclassified Corynebacterium TaxID=2624378 RepID=UPI002648011E|nr:PDZ domain-containing protein [Corynebacterium sp.]MDN5719203.1 PDZ domain-containing protein [Corynebacterium sp.]
MRTVVVGLVPVVALVALLAVPTIPGTDVNLTVPFAAEGEGPTYDTLGDVNGTPVVDITGTDAEVDEDLADSDGQLNMTTVAVRTKLSLAETMKRWLASDDTIVPVEQVIPSDSTPEEVARRNAAAFAASESNATVAAMGYLDRPLETTVYEIADDAPAAGALRENDVITAVGDTEVTLPADVAAAVAEHAPGDEVELTVQRGQSEVTESVTLGEVPEELSSDASASAAEDAGESDRAYLGVTMVAQPAGDLKVRYNLKDIGGPSAGLMFSLAVVDKLSPGEISGGKFVAGTGTISADGTVGPIGGITHKIAAAQHAGAEVFLVPSDNCSEAAGRSYDGDIDLLSVDSLDGAVDALEAYNNGGDAPTCD